MQRHAHVHSRSQLRTHAARAHTVAQGERESERGEKTKEGETERTRGERRVTRGGGGGGGGDREKDRVRDRQTDTHTHTCHTCCTDTWPAGGARAAGASDGGTAGRRAICGASALCAWARCGVGGGRSSRAVSARARRAARRAVSGHRFPRAAARAVLQAWHRIAVPRVHIVAPRGAARRCAACPPLLVHAGALLPCKVRGLTRLLGLECCAGLSSHAPLTDTSPAAPPDQRTCGAHPPHVGCRRRAGQVRMSQVTLARPTRQ